MGERRVQHADGRLGAIRHFTTAGSPVLVRWDDGVTSWVELALLTEQPESPEDPAGPASSSASPSGTGGTSLTTVGLADTAASLESSARALTRLAVNIRDEIEGRLSELWQVLIGAARAAERVGGQDGYAQGLRYAYYLMTSMDGVALEKKIAAELDSLDGTDRAKGGEPRG